MSDSKPGNAGASDSTVRRRIRVRGIVQGVGFRPTVYRLAHERHLGGWVLNDAEGVLIEVEGSTGRIDDFLQTLQDHPPPLARITAVESQAVAPTGETAFGISPSAGGQRSALVSPDMAICPDCLRELLDPGDRRFRYPFINCTNCGPRYSIILDIPYDRPKTTMQAFTMCGPCQAEYENPADRRFHAQPNACPACGPQLSLHDAAGKRVACEDPVRAVREALLTGRIVAIKGLTGFHLAADARSEAAVRELRRRKGRDQNAFAMMAGSVEAIARRAVVEQPQRALLESKERPIVLVRQRAGHDLSPLVAPRSPYFGFMLPYAPLHYLVFEGDLSPMIMTSGNLSEEPICREDDEAVHRLAGIADLYLMHNRPIHTVCDDSVTTIQRGRPLMLRRGRGYAPRPIDLPVESPQPILAVGPELKNAVCLVRGRQAFVSQHIGDLKNALAATYFEATVAKIQRLLEVAPTVIAHDLHPGYLSTRYARMRAADGRERTCPSGRRVRLVGVQHHHAHIASVMAENGLDGEVLGLAMDGTGYGPDGTIWGGEVLRASAAGFQRLGHLAYAALPGGDAAVEHPVRIAWSMLLAAFGPDEAGRHRVGRLATTSDKDLEFWAGMIAKGVNSPLACGLGRLFDAVSVLADVCNENSYEGQPAVELEAAAGDAPDNVQPYEFALVEQGGMVTQLGGHAAFPAGAWPRNSVTMPPTSSPQGWIIDTRPVIRGVVADVETGRDRQDVSARFHATVTAMLLAAARRAQQETGLARIALAGGCFANDRLVRALAPALEADGFKVYVHREVPPGDGGVALGQAYVAATLAGL
jgi:hydrogenase maturation protein HypF